MAAIALYVPGDAERFKIAGDEMFEYKDQLRRGVVRYFDVRTSPPKRGRPSIEKTYDLTGFVDKVAHAYKRFATSSEIEYSDPEPD